MPIFAFLRAADCLITDAMPLYYGTPRCLYFSLHIDTRYATIFIFAMPPRCRFSLRFDGFAAYMLMRHVVSLC